MERILIREIDNTSNIEALSSYDIVYVPGFANNDASPLFDEGPTLYRTPTLVTTKQEFHNLFDPNGRGCPKFVTDQPYPVAKGKTRGFPKCAIPNYVDPIEHTIVDGLNYFMPDDISRESIVKAVTREGTGEIPYYDDAQKNKPYSSTTTYYVADYLQESPFTITMKKFEGPEEGKSYDDYVLFTAATIASPVTLGWTEKIDGEYYFTNDVSLEFDDKNVVKAYYTGRRTDTPLMFKAGDADSGFRYAECLLSLGIPVFYEQMNAVYAEVNTEQFDKDSTNPSARGWKERQGDIYFKTKDLTIKEKTYYVGADISLDSMYKGLEARFSNSEEKSDVTGQSVPADYSFDSMGDYPVKYLTTGGYPVFEYGEEDGEFATSPIATAMIKLASDRGDALALIDHTNNPNRSIYITDKYSVVRRVREANDLLPPATDDKQDPSTYGTMFTPWYTCTHSSIIGGSEVTTKYSAQMPASLAFLTALASQLKYYNPWLAVSGVSRGQVPYCAGLHTNYILSNNVADSYQSLPGDSSAVYSGKIISINPITNIRNYGYCIWGNRTLRNNASGTIATSFLNIRSVVSDVKKKLYEASKSLLFEQNTDVLWINFKSQITPLLETMKANYILDDYRVDRYKIHPVTGEAIPAYKVFAIVRIVPVSSVEQFELELYLENEDLDIIEMGQ